MNGRVMVLCASRDRNISLQTMIESVRLTSSRADIAVYVDEDQEADYAGIKEVYVGPRIGPVASLNALWKQNPCYQAYGAATDDCEFLTQGWDEWVLRTAESFPGEVGFMAPWNAGEHHRMDFPWMTAKTAEVLGWFAYPEAKHFYWDVLLEVIGRQTRIAYAKREEFELLHDALRTEWLYDKIREDALNVVRGIAFEVPGLVEKLRAAM